MPIISILMPVCNAEAYLAECLESIAGQTFTDFELVAIDDRSADRSAAILDEWAARDSRFRCLRNETNLGIARTRNRLFAECSPSSRFLALMDADDVCFPDRLERQRAFLEANPDIGAVGWHWKSSTNIPEPSACAATRPPRTRSAVAFPVVMCWPSRP